MKQKKIYRTETLQLSICTDQVSKRKYAELKYCRCQYVEKKKAK